MKLISRVCRILSLLVYIVCFVAWCFIAHAQNALGKISVPTLMQQMVGTWSVQQRMWPGAGAEASGKYLEIEDLVATSGERSKGYGGELFDWLVKHAEGNGCSQIRLVSRVTRTDAHRFYLNKRMTIEAYYFSRQLR